METGTYPIQTLVKKKMLSYWWNVHRNQDGYTYRVVETQKEYYSHSSTWASTVEGLLNKYGITSDCRNQSKGQWERVTTKKILSHYDSMVYQTAAGMSKGKYLAERKSTIKREAYIVDLPKKHARLILLSRCDMLPFKMNRQYKWSCDHRFRLCGHVDENLVHLTTACTEADSLRLLYMASPLQMRDSLTTSTASDNMVIF